MRRVLLVLIALAAGGLLVVRLRTALASEETRIRWRLEAALEGFNDQRVAPCLRALAEDWRHADGLSREELGDGLRYLFFSERRGTFPHRVALEDETLSIEVSADPEGSAELEFVLVFETLDEETWTTSWRARVLARFVRGDEQGWRCAGSSSRTLESDGRFPGAR